MKLFIMLTVLCLSSLSFANAKAGFVKNPLAYAEKQSKDFAEGDSYDSSGWNGCADVSDDATLIKIECQGIREVLVFGGSMQKVDFSCGFTFKPGPSTSPGKRYAVLQSSCE